MNKEAAKRLKENLAQQPAAQLRKNIHFHIIMKVKDIFQRNINSYLSKYKCYRKILGGIWYKHEYTQDAHDVWITFHGTFWARYDKQNRYTEVIEVETYNKQQEQ
jgi:hypothetical protein